MVSFIVAFPAHAFAQLAKLEGPKSSYEGVKFYLPYHRSHSMTMTLSCHKAPSLRWYVVFCKRLLRRVKVGLFRCFNLSATCRCLFVPCRVRCAQLRVAPRSERSRPAL